MQKQVAYPFSAIVGQDEMKRAPYFEYAQPEAGRRFDQRRKGYSQIHSRPGFGGRSARAPGE